MIAQGRARHDHHQDKPLLTEIVDIDNSENGLCGFNGPLFNDISVNAYGGLLEGKSFVCGGTDLSDNVIQRSCYVDGSLKHNKLYDKTRTKAASAVILHDGQQRLWITGGYIEGKLDKTTEIVADGLWLRGNPLIFPVADHCLANLNLDGTLVMSIGGVVNKPVSEGEFELSKRVITYNFTSSMTGYWEEGPSLKYAVNPWICASLVDVTEEDKHYVIVLGKV